MRIPLSHLAGCTVDVAVIGGGINGASAAQHLAAAGYDVLLVDKGDFGSGATARSSRLLHCGLRYLAPGRSVLEFARHPDRLATALTMARQAMAARAEFVRTTPERATAMRFCFPIYRDGPYRTWQVDLAFGLLRALGGPGGVPLDYERLTPAQARRQPLLRGLRDPDALQAVACFREYQLDWPERLCVDAVLDAERLGARARNYTRARLVARERDATWTIALEDTLEPGSPVRVRARRVLNLAGLWLDDVTRAVAPAAPRRVVGTKGAHLLVQLPPDCAGLGLATLNSRNEPFYCVPWRGFHYFGPTETLYEGDPDHVAVTAAEADGLLAEANRLLPGYPLTRRAIVSTWAGVRPLTFDADLPLGRRSRTVHDLEPDGLPGVLALTAGPVMTHRSAGRLLARRIAAGLAPPRPPAPPDYASPGPPADELAPAPTPQTPGLTPAALRYAVRVEHAATLSDVLFRRLGVAWGEPLSRAAVEHAAAAIGPALDWAPQQAARAVDAYLAEAAALHGPPPAQPLPAPASPSPSAPQPASLLPGVVP